MDNLLRANAAAEKLGITNVHLYRLHKSGEIAAIKIGKRGIRFSEAEIQRWIKSKENR